MVRDQGAPPPLNPSVFRNCFAGARAAKRPRATRMCSVGRKRGSDPTNHRSPLFSVGRWCRPSRSLTAPFRYLSFLCLSFRSEKRAGLASIYEAVHSFNSLRVDSTSTQFSTFAFCSIFFFWVKFHWSALGGLTDQSASSRLHLGCLTRAPFHEFKHFDLGILVVMIPYDRSLAV